MVYKVRISASTEQEARKISDTLTEEEIVEGTFIISGDFRFYWKGSIEEEYFNIQAYRKGGYEGRAD
jgi:uncharacterized protein involved in tolerance to divalent cations